MDNLGVLLALIALSFMVWFWADSLRVREVALRACTRACREVDVQLLDYSVALRRLRLSRAPNGRVAWLRTYRFEYTPDGVLRLRGSAVLRGRTLLNLTMETPEGSTLHIKQTH